MDRLQDGNVPEKQELPEALAAIAAHHGMFRAAIDVARVGMFILRDERFSFVNRRFLELFDYPHDALIEQRGLQDILAPGETLPHHASQAGDGCEILCRRADGSCFPGLMLCASLSLDGQTISVGTLLDISPQKAAEEKIRELADFDVLTGLPNRRLLRERVGRMLAAAERDAAEVSVIFLDLDHFKRINDSLGHSVGDELLCQVARRLGTAVRRIDTLARLGGDEFIFALPDTHAAGAVDVARRLIETCALPFDVAGHELTMTPSLGISVFPRDGLDFETLLRNADAAMYKSKEIGRNTFQFYAAEMNTATLERLLMESNLRRALNQQEFVLYYQPLVNLRTGRIVGVEALIRWRHPDLGLIMPDRFIQVAEETGLINPIGDWVLCEATRQAQCWSEAGLPAVSVAVNVAPVQFRQAGFVEMVAGALAGSGLPAERLELEVTERTVMHDAEINLGTLSALDRMGIALSLDDFGTGYSSLAYLKRFPVKKLKIDRSFIKDIESDPDDQAIASTVVSMGRSLRLTVLAEGVETAEQLALLRAMGCDMAQGFLFSRALPPEEMAGLLARQAFMHKEKDMENTTIKVGGMSCQGCVKNITAVLQAIAGVGSAEVSLEAATATVAFDPQRVTRDALLGAIEDAGFDAE